MLILDVVANGPAASAGIRPGDVIVAVDGAEVEGLEAFLGALRRRDPGQELSVTVTRGDDRRTVTVRLGGRPA